MCQHLPRGTMMKTILARIDVVRDINEQVRTYHLSLTLCEDGSKLTTLLDDSLNERLLPSLVGVKSMVVVGSSLSFEKFETLTWEELEKELPIILSLLFAEGKKITIDNSKD